MNIVAPRTIVLLFAWLALASRVAPRAEAEPKSPPSLLDQWHQWRGPLGNGVSPTAHPPLTWNETNHVRWKIPLPGLGHSSPIVFGNRVFLLAATPTGPSRKPVYDHAPGTHDNVPVSQTNQYVVLAYDRQDGKEAWRRVVRVEFPHEGGHATGSPASHSPTTDGDAVFALFGSHGLYSLGLDGSPRWQRDLGRMNTLHAHGEGSSPVLHGDLLLVNWDHEGDSFLYALDKRTGEIRWKTPRDEITSWSTPLVIDVAGQTQVVVSATRRIRGYDVDTGRQLWECAGLTDNVVASPVYGQGILVAGNSYYRQAMVALRLEGARGDLTNSKHVAWRLNRLTPYVSSPLLYDDTVYFLRHNQNILSRLDPVTGQPRGEPLRLDALRDFIFASPVGADGRLYITGRDGTTVVLRHDRANPVLAVNPLDDTFSATPALAGGDLFLRGERFLYCLAE